MWFWLALVFTLAVRPLAAEQAPERKVTATPPSAVRVPLSSLRTTLVETPQFVATRLERYCIVELRGPHRVISTSPRTGGQSERVQYLVNYQSMEPAGDAIRHDHITSMTRDAYQAEVARTLGLEPNDVAMMGTAANMHYLSARHAEYRGLRVDAFVTAGVEGNATRASDPASWFEGEKGFEYVPHGTINTILVINRPLTAGAQARAVMTMVEAKSAALGELAVPSGASPHLATGTGTDQFLLAVPIGGAPSLEDAGTHTKLGELIGETVRQATVEALRWQNGLERSHTRSLVRALGRFGLTEPVLRERLRAVLPAESYELLEKNAIGVLMEPRVSAAAFAYAAVLDRLQYGTLPADLAGELLRDQSASVAVALSAKPALWPEYWSRIPASATDRLEPFVTGLALGWQARWTP